MKGQSFCEQIRIREQSLLPVQAAQAAFYSGDILSLLPSLSEKYAEAVQFLYIDPPFCTGQDFSASCRFGQKGYKGDRAFIADVPLYGDKWESMEAYLSFMEEVLAGAKAMLRPQGILCVHIDWRTSAHMRLLLDRILGEECFINEIIWHYRSGGASKRTFARKHDTLLLYGKSKKYSLDIAAAGEMRGEEQRNHLKKETDENGRVFFSIRSNGKIYRYYEDELIPYDDVWELPHLQQKHPERTGYGTQKPLQLLDRLVCTCSRPGDLVADLFAGSGTALVSACQNGRRALGVDNAPLSMHTVRARLLELPALELDIFHTLPTVEHMNISLNTASRNGELHIMLNSFDFVHPYFPIPQLEDGREYISYWGAGLLKNGCLQTEDFAQRSPASPYLKDTLRIANKGGSAVYFVDALGNERLLRL